MLAMLRPALLLVALAARLPGVHGLNQSYCYTSFSRLRFDILNYSQYPRYFNASTTLQLAETGIYTGISEIEEYVRTGAHPRHYTNFSTLSSETAFKVEQAFPDLCVLLQVNTIEAWTHDLAFPGAEKRAAYMLKVYFDPAGALITGINVFYPMGWLDLKYGVLLNTDAARAYVCDIMLRRCPDTWAFNNLTTMEHCASALAGLDPITPPTSTDMGGYLDGRTQACRQLHAMMAEMNPDAHCAHISLVPQVDPTGQVKCQTSKQVRVRDIFDDADLATYWSYAASSVNEQGFTVHVGCNSTSDCPLQHYCYSQSCVWVRTCGDAKAMYRQQGCCGQGGGGANASGSFDGRACRQLKAAYKHQGCCHEPTRAFVAES